MPLFDCWVSGLVTTTAADPGAVPAPVMRLMVWAPTSTATAVAATPPTMTVAPDWKPLPLTVIAVPPACGPLVGDTPATAGAGTEV